MAITGTETKRNDPLAQYRFAKGQSGNPRGRPKTDKQIKNALKKLVPESIEVLKEIITNPKAKDSDRLRAIELVFDRVFGKAPQAIQMEDLHTTVQIIDTDPEGALYNG